MVVSNVTHAQPVVEATNKPSQKPTPSQTRGDSVQLSQAAQARLAARQELSETPDQTATEAGHGDLQAQRLLARESAERAAEK